MVCVRFLRAYSIYNPGEVAGFAGAVAERLVENQVAEMYVVKAPGLPNQPAVEAPGLQTEPVKRKPGRPRKPRPSPSA